MSIPGSAHPLLLSSLEEEGYFIERSLRFNSSDSAYLSRTPASAGNRKTWTWAGWVKRSALSASTRYGLFGAADAPGTSYTVIEFYNDTIGLLDTNSGGTTEARITSAIYRDPSAWMHIALAYDTTQATASNRIKLYANGSEVTQFSTSSNPSQNSDAYLNQAVPHTLGSSNTAGTPSLYFSGYLADIHFIDGQALDPTSFGEFDDNGIWQPKAYTGTYGTNGFRLDFSDNSAATATTLGKDRAGSNNWTPVNLSVTAGAGNDSLADVPTNGAETDTGVGGEVRGNYCTLNPLNNSTTLSDGNLKTDAPTNTWYGVSSTFHVSSGKWYWEVTPTALGLVAIGVANKNVSTASGGSIDTANSYIYYSFDGNKFGPTSNNTSYGAAYASNDIIGVALDLDAGTLVFYKNNTSQGTAYSGLAGIELAPFIFINDYTLSATAVFNFGQRPFAYTAPSGFKALNTANLPAPVVTKPSDVMDVLLWSGTGGNRSLTGLGMSPDFVWIKQRNQAFTVGHQLYDIVRGAGSLKQLDSSNTTAEGGGNTDQYGYLSSFDSSGFSVTAGSIDSDYVNKSGTTYIAWAWDAGSSTVTNTQGSISSQVRANASAGFSVVTYTGTLTSVSNNTVGHGLNVAPKLIIYKNRSASANWHVVIPDHMTNTQYLNLNSISGLLSYGVGSLPDPTSSVIYTLYSGEVDVSGNNFVAYCFAPVAGYSSFGSYTGNGSTDGPFVYTGFRPRFLLVKRTNTTGDWVMIDAARSAYNVTDKWIFANLSDAEYSISQVDFLSNGFKARGIGTNINDSGSTYIYAAFAESPFAANNRAR